MSEFCGANSTQYGKAITEITDGDRELMQIFEDFGGMAVMDAAKNLAVKGDEAAETRGYLTAIRAMIDAGYRLALKDNGIGAEGSTPRELIDALAQHGGFPAEWIDQVEGKGAAEAKGYQMAVEAASKAGVKAAWTDNRKQMFK